MKLKKNKTNKTERIQIRVSVEDYNRILQKAQLYAEGNISQYLTYASLNFVPGGDDFEEEEDFKDF